MTTCLRPAACLFACLSLALLLALPGCDSTAAPFEGDADPLHDYPPISVENEDLRDALKFGTTQVTMNTPQPMQLIQPVRNISDDELHIQYRFEFFDATDKPLTALGWQFKTLTPRTEYRLEGGALENTATKWRLIVRPAR